MKKRIQIITCSLFISLLPLKANANNGQAKAGLEVLVSKKKIASIEKDLQFAEDIATNEGADLTMVKSGLLAAISATKKLITLLQSGHQIHD